MIIFEKVLDIKEIWISTSIAVLLAYMLSPKIELIEKQHGSEEQITWLFFKKGIKN